MGQTCKIPIFVNSRNENGTFTMEGGTISGNTADEGGGVAVSRNSAFAMKDGEISGNTSVKGGGVIVFMGSTFTMEGGTISGNTATGGQGGGGLWVNAENSTFTKKSGTIYGSDVSDTLKNTATSGSGHAVYVGSKRRNATAGEEIKLYTKLENGVWTFNDTSPGGVGDTTANWE